MGLLETIQATASDVYDQKPSTMTGVVKSYQDGAVTVETSDGLMENIKCVNIPKIGSACLLVPVESEYQCIPNEIDDTASIFAMGLGKFHIDENGDLIVDLPIGVSNYFSIDNNGHLIVDLDGDSREENFSINSDGELIYNEL
jgi:hypothetical protein